MTITLPLNVGLIVAYACNLNCRYCGHFAPFFSKRCAPVVSVEQIEQTCRDWSNRLRVKNAIVLSGGEALMHPDIESIIEIVGRYWRDKTKMEIFTNGTLLGGMRPSFFDLLEKWQVTVHISIHHRRLYDEIKENAKRMRNRYSFWDYTETQIQEDKISKSRRFVKNYHIVNGKAVLVPADAKKSYDKCMNKYKCCVFIDGKLWQCGQIPFTQKAYDYGIIEDSAGRIGGCYKPATPDMSDEELQKWWITDFSASCGVCPNHKPLCPIVEKFTQ